MSARLNLEWRYVGYFAGGFCWAGPEFGPGALSLHRWADRLSKQLLHAKREAHVTRNPELAAHECDLPVELAGRHINVVLRAHRNRDTRRRRGTFFHFASLIVDDHVPLAAVISRE